MSGASRLSRRQFGASMLAWSAVTMAPRLAAARPQILKPRRSARGPSKLVVLFLAGGMDDLYSVDPKEPSQVKKGILPVFAASDLVTHGSLRLAPGWSCLQPYLPRMQVISGIQCSTVAHPTGNRQIRQMRRDVISEREASFITLVGQSLAPDAILHAIHINAGFYPAGPTADGRVFVDDNGGKILAQLHKIANDGALRDISRSALGAAVRTSCSGETCESFRVVDFLINKMSGTAAPAAPPASALVSRSEWPWHAWDDLKYGDAMEYAWVLYALQNDLAPAIFMSPRAWWDTHWNNEILQRPGNHQFALGLRYLLDRLAATPRGDGRALLDEVGFLVVSELGRFPYVNAFGGKDHYPQISATLIGPGLRPGKFGETSSEMVGAAVSLSTGHPGSGATLMTLDDLGRTVLEWVGNPDPEGLGYDGRVLDFCFA
ncbi:DUF1501 domain-containing protein [Sorangium sp. So ce1128]|uniref:DUF1501 domain-containing protein n=1 Tax=Sorangium cellulosum TaxID=56 RepID=A0A3S7UZU9_SORCE|nr:hypothetical protein [Sorangium cellulosum]